MPLADDSNITWNHYAFDAEHIEAIQLGIDVRNPIPKRIGSTKPEVPYGQDAQAGQFPWIVSLQRKSNGKNTHICSGALIHEYLILTAARCLYPSKGKFQPPEQAYVGATNLNKGNDAMEIFPVSDVYWPPNYNAQASTRSKYDIAVVRISGASTIRPVSLSEYDPRGGINVTAVGWGPQGTSKKAKTQLKWATLTLGTSGEKPCPNYRFGTLCAVGNSFNYGLSSSACQGDHGAPHLVADTSVLVGISSFNSETDVECALTPYQGLTSVATYLNSFIKPLMSKFDGIIDVLPGIASPAPPSPVPSPPGNGMANVSDFEDTNGGCTAYRTEVLRNQRFRYGTPISNPFTAGGRDACAAACVRNQPCMSFNFQHTNKTCILLKEEGGTLATTRDVRFTAGFLVCTRGN